MFIAPHIAGDVLFLHDPEAGEMNHVIPATQYERIATLSIFMLSKTYSNLTFLFSVQSCAHYSKSNRCGKMLEQEIMVRVRLVQ